MTELQDMILKGDGEKDQLAGRGGDHRRLFPASHNNQFGSLMTRFRPVRLRGDQIASAAESTPLLGRCGILRKIRIGASGVN
jgi:hypothetical protein